MERTKQQRVGNARAASGGHASRGREVGGLFTETSSVPQVAPKYVHSQSAALSSTSGARWRPRPLEPSLRPQSCGETCSVQHGRSGPAGAASARRHSGRAAVKQAGQARSNAAWRLLRRLVRTSRRRGPAVRVSPAAEGGGRRLP